ncbi:asparagine--tRNA ligase [bacterium]|nr:asparagine--tRNA ligase [bacterium]
MKRQKIKALLEAGRPQDDVLVKGWVRTRRGSKKVAFIELNDGSTLDNLQLVVDGEAACFAQVEKLSTGAAMAARGRLVPSQGRGQTLELQVAEVVVYGGADEKYPLQKKGHSLEFLREIAHLRPRTNTFGAVFRLRHALAYGIHKFFHERGFYYVHTPIITTSDCEGAGQMFQVTTLPLASGAPPDFAADFFGKPAYLTVSGQLEGELFALALGEIYTFGPTFRAENSNTPRHLAEFWMIEPEMAFYDLDDNMDLAEDFLKSIILHCMSECPRDLAFLNDRYQKDLLDTLKNVTESRFARITYSEAIEILGKSGETFEFPTHWGADLQTEHERYLTEKHFRRPVIVYNYPKAIKAFYMRQNDDGRTVAAMDVLFPRIGEMIGGSQREERLEVLSSRIRELGLPEASYQWYLDTRRFGTAPHSGFGLGFERTLQFITGMGNIRDVIPFPRTPGSAEF